MINVGIIRYPGSNCDLETFRYFNFNDENKCFFIWHKETDFSLLNDLDLLVLPGGFAFGIVFIIKLPKIILFHLELWHYKVLLVF